MLFSWLLLYSLSVFHGQHSITYCFVHCFLGLFFLVSIMDPWEIRGGRYLEVLQFDTILVTRLSYTTLLTSSPRHQELRPDPKLPVTSYQQRTLLVRQPFFMLRHKSPSHQSLAKLTLLLFSRLIQNKSKPSSIQHLFMYLKITFVYPSFSYPFPFPGVSLPVQIISSILFCT